MSATRTARKIIKAILSREQMDGDGARGNCFNFFVFCLTA